jgi:hypothetical protein
MPAATPAYRAALQVTRYCMGLQLPNDPKDERRWALAGDAPAERWDNTAMNAPQPMSPRGRLQDLLAIAESQRTDAQWDEIHALEIELSSANREQSPEQGVRRNTPATAAGQPRPRGGAQGKKPFQRTHKRRPKQNSS